MPEVSMQISISDELGAILKNLSAAMNMTIDQLLRKFIGLDPPDRPSQALPFPASPTGGGTLRTREAPLPAGLLLRKVFKGQERRAVVEQDGIRVEGQSGVFLSPSLAAVAVTGYNTNGWAFWDYRDDGTNSWKPLDNLRNDLREGKSGCLDVRCEDASRPSDARVYWVGFAPIGSHGAVPYQGRFTGEQSLRAFLASLQDRANMEPGRPEYHADEWIRELRAKGRLGLFFDLLDEKKLAPLSIGS